MKTRYLKRMMAASFAAASLFLSSCLKDNQHYFNPEAVPSVGYMPKSGLYNFALDAVTAQGLDTVTFAVGVTGLNPPTTAVSLTVAVDNTIITTYNAANPAIAYQPIPTAAFKLNANVTVPAGKTYGLTTIIIDRTQLDPSQSYMLPVKIASASGLPISSDFGVHYFHIIGNDFAGTYLYDYLRYNNGVGPSAGPPSTSVLNSPTVIAPVSPTQFEMATSYVGPVRYEVTFTKGGTAAAPTYSNFAVTFNSGDVTSIWTASGISIITPPVIVVADPVNKIFEFSYTVFNGTANRFIDDRYHLH